MSEFAHFVAFEFPLIRGLLPQVGQTCLGAPATHQSKPISALLHGTMGQFSKVPKFALASSVTAKKYGAREA
jgi:hypothetical protein